jgi:hypothetical protein
MATTINSGYANSPKLTANIADHADVYGGRSLVFDGVVDKLNIDTIEIENDFTISGWFKRQSLVTNYLFGHDANNYIRFHGHDRFFINIYGNTYFGDTTQIPFAIGNWFHLALTRDSNNLMKLYFNGEKHSEEETSVDNVFKTSYIGGSYTESHNPYYGSMADIKFFDAQLTEAQVQELYKKPENTPSAVQDNLVAWYPMIEGNPESPQSIVYDHSEKKLKEETTDSTFQVDVAGDTAGDHWKNIGSATIISGGKLIYDRDIGLGKFRPMTDSSTEQTFTNGSLYKLTITIDDITGHASNQALINLDWFGGLTYFDVGTSVFYGVGDGGNLAFIISTNRGSFEMSQCKVEEVQMGNHATTNFFGDDLTNGHGAFDVTTNWSVVSGSLGTEWSIIQIL